MPPDFDVAIIGAGAVGGALALALADSSSAEGQPLRVALVEGRPLSTEWPSPPEGVEDFDPRVSALSPASKAFLEDLKLWEPAAERGVCAFRRMSVWDGGGTGRIHFRAEEAGAVALGWLLENRLLSAAMAEQLRAEPGIQLLEGTSLEELLSAPGKVVLRLSDGRQLEAALAVGADGGASRVRSVANFPVREWDTGQTAIVGTVETACPHGGEAWQCFREGGILALLPLHDPNSSGRFSSFVFSLERKVAADAMALDAAAFAAFLERSCDSCLGTVMRTGLRLSFPLRQRWASPVQGRVVLAGDAAHTIHPLAGQGVNLGLGDAKVLAEELLRWTARGGNAGDAAPLLRYRRRRKEHNLGMLAAMSGFQRLFTARAPTLRWLRGIGLHGADQLTPVKRWFMREAMGLGMLAG